MQPVHILDHYADGAFEGMHGIEEISGRSRHSNKLTDT